MNVLVNVLGCQWGVYLKTWTWRTAWEVREKGELGRKGFHAEGTVKGFEEGFVAGVFVGIFQMELVEVLVVFVEIVLGAAVAFGDTYSVSFSVGVLGWMQSFFLLWFPHCLSTS